jgi:hypothetical protein
MVTAAQREKMDRIIKYLLSLDRVKSEAMREEILYVCQSVATAYVAQDYEAFIVSARELKAIYEKQQGSMGIPADREEQEHFEVGSDHR